MVYVGPLATFDVTTVRLVRNDPNVVNAPLGPFIAARPSPWSSTGAGMGPKVV